MTVTLRRPKLPKPVFYYYTNFRLIAAAFHFGARHYNWQSIRVTLPIYEFQRLFCYYYNNGLCIIVF